MEGAAAATKAEATPEGASDHRWKRAAHEEETRRRRPTAAAGRAGLARQRRGWERGGDVWRRLGFGSPPESPTSERRGDLGFTGASLIYSRSANKQYSQYDGADARSAQPQATAADEERHEDSRRRPKQGRIHGTRLEAWRPDSARSGFRWPHRSGRRQPKAQLPLYPVG